EQFWADAEPNRPNQHGPIRAILIDFHWSRGLRVVGCAKLFRSSETRAAAKLCAICDTYRRQKSPAKRIRATITQRQKPLFHRMFFNFLLFRHKRISSAPPAPDQVRCCALDGPRIVPFRASRRASLSGNVVFFAVL